MNLNRILFGDVIATQRVLQWKVEFVFGGSQVSTLFARLVRIVQLLGARQISASAVHVNGNVLLQFLYQFVSAAHYNPAIGGKPNGHFRLSFGVVSTAVAMIRQVDFYLGLTRMKRHVSNGSDISVGSDHVRIPAIGHGPVEEFGNGSDAVNAPSRRFYAPEHVALISQARMRQVIFTPRSEMKENGVVGVDVRSVGWSFALPNGAPQLLQNVPTVPNAVILVLDILVCIEMNYLECYVM